MTLVFKQTAAGTVPTPRTGSNTLFVDSDGTPKVKDDTGTVTTLKGANGPTNAYLKAFVDAPSSPDAFDFDASLATDPDLANNGFLVHLQNTPWTTLTRAGNVDFFGSAPTGNTYHSTLSNGLLFLRFPTSTGVAITKQFDTATSGWTIKTHAWLTRLYDSTNSTAGFCLSWYIAGLSNPAGAAQYGAAGTQLIYAGILNTHWELTSWTVGNAPTTQQNVTVTTDFGEIIVYQHLSQFASGQDYAVRGGTPTGFRMPAAPFNGSNSLQPQRGGIMVNNGSGQFVVIDSIRKLPLSTFP